MRLIMMRRLLIFIVLISAVSCDVIFHRDPNGHYYFACTNTSDNTVYIDEFSPDVSIHYLFGYPEEFHRVDPGITNNRLCPSGRRTYESYLRDKDILYIYVFPSYTDEAVVLDDFKLVCYKLTLDDFIALDFRLSYPPDERMKDMEMDPPYNSFYMEESQ